MIMVVITVTVNTDVNNPFIWYERSLVELQRYGRTLTGLICDFSSNFDIYRHLMKVAYYMPLELITVWTLTFGIQEYTIWSNGIMQYSLIMDEKYKVCL